MIRKRIYLIIIVSCLLILIAAVAAGCAGKGTSDGTGGGQVTLIFEKDARGEGYAVAGFEKSASVRGGQKVVIPDTYNGLAVTSVKSGAFENSDKIVSVKAGNNVKNIGDKAFAGCTALTEVEIGNNVTEVGEYVFSGCSALEKVVFPGNLRILTRGMFSGCSSLKEVAVPDSVKEIRGSVFYNCSSLKSVSFGDSVTLVGLSAFYGCAGIENVYYSGGLADWLAISFFDGVANPLNGGAALYLNGAPCTELVLPEGTVKVGNNVFFGCGSLTSVTIPASVTNIGSQAFSGCKNLAEILYEGDLTAWCGIDGLANVMTRGVSLYIDGEPLGSELTIPDSVTSVKYGTFLGCTGLTSVVVGDNVTSISEGAFSGCSSLESITLPFVGNNADGTSAGLFGYIFGATEYVGGTAVRQVYNNRESVYCIPSRLRCVTLTGGNIPQSAFYGCSMLTSVNMPETLADIGSYAFSDCTGLTSVIIPDSVTSIGSDAFRYCYKLVEVYNKSSLNITAGDSSYGDVGYYAKNVYTEENGSRFTDTADGYRFLYDGTKGYFMGYNGEVTDIALPESFTAYDGTAVNTYEIYQYAFCGNTALTSVKIPDSVTSIGDYAFRNCSGLTSVTIGSSVAVIGVYAFENCTGLTSVYYTGDIAGWCGISFVDSYANPLRYAGNLYIDGQLVGDVVIPDSVTEINAYAFLGCTGLTAVYYAGDIAGWCDISFGGSSANPLRYAGNLYIDGQIVEDLVIPDSVTEIKAYAFYGCTGLTSVAIGNSVTSIEDSAFYNCMGLTSVTIGNSVTSIGEHAFYDCTGLTSVYYTGDIAGWCGISFGDMYANPLCYAGKLYIDGQLVTDLVIPDSVTSIGRYAFSGCTNLTSVVFEDTEGWQVSWDSDFSSYTSLASADLADAYTAATYLKSTYYYYDWRKVEISG